MADVIITIPNSKVPALKSAIEYAYVAGLIAPIEGIVPDENGNLSNADVLEIFKEATYSYWRRKMKQSRQHEAEANAQEDDIFDPNLLP